MKLNDQNSIEQIAKYLANEMNENERANFEIDAALDRDSIVLINEMKKDWKMLDSYKNNKKVDTNRAWDKLNARFEQDSLIPTDQGNNNRKNNARMYMSIAAAFVGIIAIAASLVWGLKDNTSAKMVSVLNGVSGNTVVQTLNDGSIIYLNNKTSFSYPEVFASNERKVNLRGEAFFDITRNPQKPFIIETNDAIVEVLGTAFNIKSYEKNRFELIVERGKVRVTLKNHPEVSQVVVAGEQMNLSDNHLIKSKWVDDGSLSWRISRMQFKDETLHNIAKVINANYGSNITIPDAETSNRKLTVTFDNNSLNDILELICLSMDLKKTQVGDKIVISDANEH